MSNTTSTFSPDKPPATWQERIDSYGQHNNILWKLVQAFEELALEGTKRGKPIDKRSGLPVFTETELDQLVSELDTKSPLKCSWNAEKKAMAEGDKRPQTLHQYLTRVRATSNKQTRAFYNNVPIAPVSVMVCPTKRYLSFEHFIEEASSREIGDYFKAVLEAGTAEIKEFDEKIGKDPVLGPKRAFYENAFAEARTQIAQGKRAREIPGLMETVKKYAEESRDLGFVVRDPRTGNSGFRVVFNNGTGTSGMSQPHLHAQILGGRFLGALADIRQQDHNPEFYAGKLAHGLAT